MRLRQALAKQKLSHFPMLGPRSSGTLARAFNSILFQKVLILFLEKNRVWLKKNDSYLAGFIRDVGDESVPMTEIQCSIPQDKSPD